MEPVWSLFLTCLAAKTDFNSPKTDTMRQGNYHTGLVGVFRAHFEVILGPRVRLLGLFGAYFSPVWLPKMTLMAPKLILWDKGITILDWWGPLGPILE